MFRLLTKNSKIKKNPGVYNFSLPAGKTCVGCSVKCYALKGAYRFPAVKNKHQLNYDASTGSCFIERMIQEIKKYRKINTVRIHDSGDFYSQDYLDKWTKIAKQLPDIRFYCYTKSLQLDWSRFDALLNTKRIQSVGGEHDSLIDADKPIAKIFDSAEALSTAKYTNCSEDDSIAASTGVALIGLIKH